MVSPKGCFALSLASLVTLTLCQPTQVCQNGWLYVSGHCWLYVQQPQSWADAQRQCQIQSATLASIHTPAESQFLYSLISKTGYAPTTPNLPGGYGTGVVLPPGPGQVFPGQLPAPAGQFPGYPSPGIPFPQPGNSYPSPQPSYPAPGPFPIPAPSPGYGAPAPSFPSPSYPAPPNQNSWPSPAQVPSGYGNQWPSANSGSYGVANPYLQRQNRLHKRTKRQFDFQSALNQDINCFEEIPNALLVGLANEVVSDISADQCALRCLGAETDPAFNPPFKCLSFMHFPDARECVLVSENRQTQPDLFTTTAPGDERTNYYENNCDNITPAPITTTRRPVGPTPPPTGIAVCYTAFPGMIITGYVDEPLFDITLDQCLTECYNAQTKFNLNCLSVMYFPADQFCVLAAATKDTNAPLFGPDPEGDYYEKIPGCTFGQPSTCDPLVDLVFVVDGSSSIGPADFENIRQYMALIVNELPVGPLGAQFGAVQFNNAPYSEFNLNQFQSKEQILAAIQRMPWRSGHTRIGSALEYTRDQALTFVNGDRAGVQNVLIVFSDGISEDNPLAAAQSLRNQGVVTYAVGVTEALHEEQLRTIAGIPERVYKVRQFNVLDTSLREAVIAQMCGTNPGGNNVPANNKDGVWIGLQKPAGSTTPTWSDNTPFDYENWEPGQPTMLPGEECGMSVYEPLQRWRDVSCQSLKPFICKRLPAEAARQALIRQSVQAVQQRRISARQRSMLEKYIRSNRN